MYFRSPLRLRRRKSLFYDLCNPATKKIFLKHKQDISGAAARNVDITPHVTLSASCVEENPQFFFC